MHVCMYICMFTYIYVTVQISVCWQAMKDSISLPTLQSELAASWLPPTVSPGLPGPAPPRSAAKPNDSTPVFHP